MVPARRLLTRLELSRGQFLQPRPTHQAWPHAHAADGSRGWVVRMSSRRLSILRGPWRKQSSGQTSAQRRYLKKADENIRISKIWAGESCPDRSQRAASVRASGRGQIPCGVIELSRCHVLQGHLQTRRQVPVCAAIRRGRGVVEIGENVQRWKVGDRVCPIFMQGWLGGALTREEARTALGGGDLDGVLREYAAFDEGGLVRCPDHLSYEEAATLPCAAVTAWHALSNSEISRRGSRF